MTVETEQSLQRARATAAGALNSEHTASVETDALPPGLEIRDLNKSFHGVPAVEDVSLTVEVGEFVTLLGPSGSGKTTTLNMVAGFLLPDTGVIRIGGQDVSRVAPEHRGIGIVFQSYALFPHMTVAENVAFPLRRRKIRGAELKARVEKALADVELTHRSSAKPRELSGGQQQRAALARALVFQPSLILFDEPLGALDRRLRERLQVQLREMHEHLRFTALYVTHDQEEALQLSDRIGIMNHARLVQIGGCQEIYKQPRSAFVARFLGDANLMRVAILDCAASMCLARVEESQTEVEVRHSEDVAVEKDSLALLVVRPEALSVVSQGSGGDTLLAHGTLLDRVFVGQDMVSLVETEAGTRVRIRERPEGVVCMLPIGDEVDVVWRSLESATIVPNEELPD